jgi:hypothetical protein
LLKKNSAFLVSRKMMQRASAGDVRVQNKTAGVMVAQAASVSIQAGV